MVFGSLFDYDGDGELSTMECALGFATFASIADDIESDAAGERARELRDDLHLSSLDEFDLSLMGDLEREDTLERAGLNPSDYDDFDW